jgi:hypothetical protein
MGVHRRGSGAAIADDEMAGARMRKLCMRMPTLRERIFDELLRGHLMGKKRDRHGFATKY